MSSFRSKRIAVVLGGGGLKGFAHIGVLRALAELGIEPVVVAGTSIGALVGAAYAAGRTIDEMVDRAVSFRRRDLFRINHMGMVMERMRSPAIYLEQPLRSVIESIVPDVTFDDLPRRLLVNTVDIARGTQMVWGLHGLRDVSVLDAVYASCALPGFFPPGTVSGRTCVDGGVLDNLPVSIAGLGVDAVIAVDVGSLRLLPKESIQSEGFANIYMRAATTMMHELQVRPLTQWSGSPLFLVLPGVSHVDWFDATQTPSLIDAGYMAAMDALRDFARCVSSATGVFPRRRYRIAVDQAACIGCGLCVAMAPDVMDMNRHAFPRQPEVEWSPADGDFVRQCPTNAISVVSAG
jgi:NTE family protein